MYTVFTDDEIRTQIQLAGRGKAFFFVQTVGPSGYASIAKHCSTYPVTGLSISDSQKGGDIDWKAYCEIIRANTHIRELDMESSRFDVNELEYVLSAIEKNTNIKKLALVYGSVNERTAPCVALFISKNATIRQINLSNNIINLAGYRLIFDAIVHNVTLRELTMRRNTHDDVVCEYLVQCIQHNYTITRVFSCNIHGIICKKCMAIDNILDRNRAIKLSKESKFEAMNTMVALHLVPCVSRKVLAMACEMLLYK